MPFSDEVKLEVKRRAHFRCCKCQEGPIEVHHIIPEGKGGPDTFENAAPLCPSCHGWFGDNPLLKKTITEMRDWWYSQCRLKEEAGLINMGELNEALLKQEGRLGKKLDSIGHTVESLQTDVEHLRTELGNLKKSPGVARNAKLKAKVQRLETQATAISGALTEELLSTTAYLRFPECPECGSQKLESSISWSLGQPDLYRAWYKCISCGNEWTEGQ